jgi:hypothetical protein
LERFNEEKVVFDEILDVSKRKRKNKIISVIIF